MAEAFDFGDLNLQEQGGDASRPSGDYHSIDEVINQVIWVTGFVDGVLYLQQKVAQNLAASKHAFPI